MASKRQLRSATAAAAAEAANVSEGERTLENLWVAFCKLRTEYSKQADDLKRANMAIDSLVESMGDMQEELDALRLAHNGVADAVNEISEEEAGSAKIAALNLLVEDVQKQLTAHAEKVAAIQQPSPGSPRTYAAVAGQPPHHATPTMHTFRLVPSKHGNAQGALNQVPASTAEATKLAVAALHDLQHDLHAASVRVQWSQPKTASAKSAPVAVVIGLMQTDACMLRSLLWEEQAKQKLQHAGWRLSIHLSPEELKCKQLLWAHFGKQLRAWVDAGKRLIYSKHHQAVTVQGEAAALQLPAAAGVPHA